MFLRELYENLLLFENYNGKLNKLKTELPDHVADIDARVNWAKQVFNDRNQSMLWYISLYEAWLKQNTDPKAKAVYERMLGGANPIDDFAVFESELNHWLGTPRFMRDNRAIQLLSRINAQTTTVDSLVKNLIAVEEDIKKADEEELKNKTPIDILEGDHVVLPLGKQGDWWLLPTRSHEPESKFMGHCGTAAQSSSVLLSLRDKTPVPWVTMEYNPERKELHQMKGRSNSKPANKFHYAILALLLSDIVEGIYGTSYQASSDFSIFDMKEDLINQISQAKPKLIVDQINKFPIDFLRSPISVRSDPDYRKVAITRLPGINLLVDTSGNVSTDEATWEQSIKSHPLMIIYAPNTLQDWEKRVTRYMIAHPRDLGYCDNRIRANYNIMKSVIENANPAAIELVPYRAPHYKELAHLALSRQPQLIKGMNTDGWTREEVKAAWLKAAKFYLNTPDWPVHLFTEDDEKDIWKSQIRNEGSIITKLPDGLFDGADLVELWNAAVDQNHHLVVHKSFVNATIPEEEKDKIRNKAVRNNQGEYIERFRPDLVEDEDERERLWLHAIRRLPNLIRYLPDALISNSLKHEFVNETLRNHPEYVNIAPYIDSYYDETQADFWVRGCYAKPDNLREFPEHLLKNKAILKKAWIAVFSSKMYNPFKLNEIPKGLFNIELLKSITKDAIEKDPNQLEYADPELIDGDLRLQGINLMMTRNTWKFLELEENPLPPESFTTEEIRDVWTDALEFVAEDDANNSLYLITSDWLPYHLLDRNLIKHVLFTGVEHDDDVDNDCIINRLNYNVFTKILTPKEIDELHLKTIQHSNNGENGGAFAAIPSRYQTFELAATALRLHMYQIDGVVASDKFSEEQLNELRDIAGHPTEEEAFQDYIREMKESIEQQQWRPDPFEGQQ